MRDATVKEESVEFNSEQPIQQLDLLRYKWALARGNFLKNLDLVGVSLAARAIIEGCSGGSVSRASGPSETDVLNIAFNLEYLEGQFYSVDTTGKLSSSVTGGPSMAHDQLKRRRNGSTDGQGTNAFGGCGLYV